eukprot:291693_1
MSFQRRRSALQRLPIPQSQFRPPRHTQRFQLDDFSFSENNRSQTQTVPTININYLKPDLNSKTLEWLKLRHLIDNTTSNEINDKAVEIFSIFGGIKSHLKSLLNNISNEYFNKTQLLSLINLLQKKDENTSKKNKNDKYKQIFNMRTLSNDMT